MRRGLLLAIAVPSAFFVVMLGLFVLSVRRFAVGEEEIGVFIQTTLLTVLCIILEAVLVVRVVRSSRQQNALIDAEGSDPEIGSD